MPFLGSVYQIFGLYPEIYYGMISAELAEQQRLEQAENEETETEA
ncbi:MULTISPECIES: phosphonate ABC transporter permease [unclassified Bacillus cereus group]|nr:MULTISPECIES: phosphonate ABC transporter permease [unclassified Bacillus cereus group]MDA1643588.1 phosphonate ABC transporter permease [Bacillus cereus group sp. TH163-1LC]MDA1793253.1 phosphonate ABC transporter permease [Bacillus cereus group sp. BY8-1LC]